MPQTRIINRPEQRLLDDVTLKDRFGRGPSDTEDEHNLTVMSQLEGRLGDRKEFGRWLDKLNSTIRPPRRKNRKERRAGG